MTSNRSTIA